MERQPLSVDLQSRIDSAVSAIDRMFPELVAQLGSLSPFRTPMVAGIDMASQLLPQVPAQWAADSMHRTLWDSNLAQFPRVALNRSMSQNSPKSQDTGSSHSNQLSVSMLDQFHNLPLPLQSLVHRHIADLTGMDDGYVSSSEEPDSFSFTLTSAEFLSAKGCDGSCMWPNTHCCYSCGGPHLTKTCPTITASNPPTHHGADTKSPFRQLDTKADKSGTREDRDRRDYKDEDDCVSEEWHCGSYR